MKPLPPADTARGRSSARIAFNRCGGYRPSQARRVGGTTAGANFPSSLS
jgi:hypothetical protein